MSYTKKDAYVIEAKGWDENLLAHPLGKFLWEHEKLFDAKKFEEAQAYYSPDLVYIRPTSESFKGAEAIANFSGDYALFTDFFHEPFYGVITETPDGYSLLGLAKVFINLPGEGEKKAEDLQGRKWDVVSSGAFLFYTVKDPSGPDGLLTTHFQVFADQGGVFKEAIKRGLIPAAAFTG